MNERSLLRRDLRYLGTIWQSQTISQIIVREEITLIKLQKSFKEKILASDDRYYSKMLQI